MSENRTRLSLSYGAVRRRLVREHDNASVQSRTLGQVIDEMLAGPPEGDADLARSISAALGGPFTLTLERGGRSTFLSARDLDRPFGEVLGNGPVEVAGEAEEVRIQMDRQVAGGAGRG